MPRLRNPFSHCWQPAGEAPGPAWLPRTSPHNPRGRDRTFSEEALERGVAVSEDGVEQAGMGVAVGDFNLGGHLDLLKTHFPNDAHGLYENAGEGVFEHITIRAGLGRDSLRRLGRRNGRFGQQRLAGSGHRER